MTKETLQLIAQKYKVGGELQEDGQKIQTSNYKTRKSQGCALEHDAYGNTDALGTGTLLKSRSKEF